MMTVEEKREKRNEYKKRRQDDLHARGLCAYCGQPLGKDRLDKLYCNMCKATYTEYKNLWNHAHSEAMERGRKYGIERYARLKAEHRCTNCAKPLDEGWDHVLCADCGARNKESAMKHRGRKKQN